MALDLRVTYPGQIADGDTNYPFGKAQNEVIDGDGSGTPLEAQLVNEVLGFFQDLMVTVGDTPNGVPERVGLSQYASAIYALIDQAASPIAASVTALSDRVAALESITGRPGLFNIAQQGIGDGSAIRLTEVYDPASDYVISSGTDIKFERTGYFWVSTTINFTGASSGDSATDVGVKIRRGSSTLATAKQFWNLSASQDAAAVHLRTLVQITDIASQRLSLAAIILTGAGDEGAGALNGYLTIEPAA